MLRFRLFGIPFVVAGYFWIGALLLGGIGGASVSRLVVWVLCVFVSIIIHELGHALMGRRFGAQPHVLLHGIGGLTFLPGARLTRGPSILVSLAGPAFGFGLWGVVKAGVLLAGDRIFELPPNALVLTKYALVDLLFINGFWTIFNLLPILPLDGGQVFREVLGPRRIQITRAVGATVATFICVLAALKGQIFIALFLGILAFQNYRGDASNMPGGVEKS